MAAYATLKAAIRAVIKQNGNNEITGPILQQALLSMINSLGDGYQFKGVATPATNPGTPDQNVFYIASEVGTYSNFGLSVGENEVAVFLWDGSWSKQSTGAASAEGVNQLGQELRGNGTLGAYLTSTGDVIPNPNFGYTDYIEIGAYNHTFNWEKGFEPGTVPTPCLLIYDTNKELIGYYTTLNNSGLLYRAKYVRLSYGLGDVIPQFTENGTTLWERVLPSMYEEIKKVSDDVASLQEDYEVTKANVDGNIFQSNVSFDTSGNIVPTDGYAISDYIPLNSYNHLYQFDREGVYAYTLLIVYDSNKQFKTYYSMPKGSAISFLYGSAYARVSFLNDTSEARLIDTTANEILWEKKVSVNDSLKALNSSNTIIENNIGYEFLKDNVLSAIKNYRVFVSKSLRDNRLSLAFLTDVHLTSNGGKQHLQRIYTMSKFAKSSPARFLLFGGDLVSGENTIELDMRVMGDGKEAFKDNFATPLFMIRGNHDGGHKTWKAKVDGGGTATDADEVSNDDWYNMMVSSENGIVRDKANPMGAYYYKDFDDAKIRLIVLNCYDMPGTNPDGNVYNAMWSASALWQKQIDWLVDVALNFTEKGNDKTNWGVIVASHDGVITDNYPYGNGAKVELILQAFKNGSQYDYSYSYQSDPNYYSAKSVDFRSQGAMNFIAYIHGHTHTDRIIFDENVPIISTGAAHPDDTENVPAGATLALPRVDGELSEYLWDTIAIGNDEIDIFRFGAGHNRYVHLGGNNISVGESITLTPTKLSGTLTWGAFSNSPGYYVPFVNGVEGTPVGTLVQNAVVSNGVVTGVSVGSATIYAEDENGNREFFGIIIG